VLAFSQCCGAKVPILFNLVGAKIILISSPANIRAVLFNPHVFTTHKYRADFIKYALGLPPKAVELICADTSGPLREPLPGSNVPPHRRILRMQQENTFEFVSKAGLPHLLPKYTQNYEESVSATGIGYEWVEVPDLFIFLRDLAMDASVNTLCGKSFLEQSPGFSEALWTFDANVHFLYMNFPKWLRPQAAKARDEALESISRWRRTAIKKSRGKVFDDSQMFDDIWGSKIMRGRNEMYDKFPEFDERSRAGADLGVIWAWVSIACLPN
jgi:cytochrome P450